MIESQQVSERIAMGEVRGEIKGEIKLLLRALAALFPPEVPPDLETAIRQTASEEQLQNWLDLALKAKSLEGFRQASGL